MPAKDRSTDPMTPQAQLFCAALDRDDPAINHEIVLRLCTFSDPELGALLGACRRLTHAIRGELRARTRTEARLQAEAEEASKDDSNV